MKDRLVKVLQVIPLFVICLGLFHASLAQAASVTLVTTGASNPNEWPIMIGLKKGFFAGAGIDLTRVSAPSAAGAVQQVAAGSADMQSGGITDPIRAIAQGAGISIIRIHAQVPSFTVWAKPGLKSISDLRGKTVMLGGAKDITRVYFERMVRPNGLAAGSYDMIYAGTTPSRFAALQSGAIDATILLPPFSFRAEQAGFSLIGRISDYVKDMPFTAYSVNTKWAKANRATVVSFFGAYQRSIEWFRDPSNRQEAIDILIVEAKVNPSDAAATYDFFTSIDIFAPKGAVTAKSLASVISALVEDGDLRSPADPKQFVDAEIAAMNGGAEHQ